MSTEALHRCHPHPRLGLWGTLAGIGRSHVHVHHTLLYLELVAWEEATEQINGITLERSSSSLGGGYFISHDTLITRIGDIEDFTGSVDLTTRWSIQVTHSAAGI